MPKKSAAARSREKLKINNPEGYETYKMNDAARKRRNYAAEREFKKLCLM